MASHDDRKSIQSLQGIQSTTKVPSLFPDHSARWKGSPKPIEVPRNPPPHTPRLRSTVKNPYTQTHPATNPTANQTLLNKKPPGPRKTVRQGDAKVPTFLKDRRKGKAVERTRSLSSPEIIDVDAHHASTDDLNIIPPSSPIISSYFDSKPGSCSRAAGDDGLAPGPPLVGDGENTKQLQARQLQTRMRTRSSSPISNYTEDDEGRGVKVTKPRSKVLQEVAKIEAKTVQRLPVVDLRTVHAKDRMQPKASSAKLRPLSQFARDPLSEPSGLRNNSQPSKPQALSLPILELVLGIQRLSEYEFIEFEDRRKIIKFTGSSSRPIGPISVAETFHEAQYSEFKSLEDEKGYVVLYLNSLVGGQTAPWQLNYSSVFQMGASDNRGQITIRFNTKHKRWNAGTYQTCITHLRTWVSEHSALRPNAAETLWQGYSNTKYSSGHQSSTLPTDHGESPIPYKRELDAEQEVELTSRRKNAEDPDNNLRRMPYDRSIQSLRGRPPDSRRKQDSTELSSVAEPPSKRQRTEEPTSLRWSARKSAQQDQAAQADLDEVILVYPFGVPGAVNITVGDLNRLLPEEFLNDTLIEFGLKSWLKELEVTNPDLATEVHVFNSFFYKKLNKRNIKEGYDSVRKWTSKIDIFRKKYIIVPINENLHWYLVLIYEPEHVLQPPLSSLVPQPTPVTRRQARESQPSERTEEAPVTVSLEPIIQAQENISDQDMQDGTTSENEVEQLAFSASCSITVTSDGSSKTSSATNLKEELVRESGIVDLEDVPGSPMKVDDDNTIDGIESSGKLAATSSAMGSGTATPIDDDQLDSAKRSEIAPTHFYGKSSKSKKRASDGELALVDEDPSDVLSRTKIFVFDSLGTRHLQATRQLSRWLELEAQDKKGVEIVTPPIAKMAPVPVQPNYCDCGLYILHFAATFMSDPKHYCNIIMTKERPTMSERRTDWKDASVASMRDNLRGRILQFSTEWRQLRTAREGEKKQESVEEEDEDSDVAIVEHVKSGKKGRSGRPVRART